MDYSGKASTSHSGAMEMELTAGAEVTSGMTCRDRQDDVHWILLVFLKLSIGFCMVFCKCLIGI